MTQPVERQLAAATLKAVRRESAERHGRLQSLAPTPTRHQTLRPRTLSKSDSGRRSVVVQRDVTALTPLTREVEPCPFAECAYEPPRRPDQEEQMAGAARWEMLGTDEVRACVLILCADDMGALVCTHRAFAAPVEEAARYLLSKTRDAPAPRRCRISNAFCEPAWRAFKACARYHRLDAASKLAAGGAHSLLLGDALRACGRGTCGQLGLGAGFYDVTVPTPVPMNRRVVSVAAGAHHSLCVCADGNLWAWGKASDHQLGIVADDAMAPAPIRVRLPEDLGVAQVAAGAAHSLAVDVDGGLWSWGRNAHGQLGHGTARPSSTPRRVLPLRARPVIQVSAGAFHSLAVLREGALYAFGLGADGRLGLGHQLNATLPEMVPLHQFVRQACAGATHSACVDSAGCLYTWGDGAKGALGHLGPRPRKNKSDTGLASMPSWESALRLGEALQHSAGAAPSAELTPRPVAALRHVRVVQVQCNERETLALDGDGVVYVVGQACQTAPASPTLSKKAASPLAGIGRARSTSFSAKPQAKQKSSVVAHRFHAPVLEVASSERHVVLRTTEGTYFAWGGGDGGAGLGVGDAKGRTRPTMLPPWP